MAVESRPAKFIVFLNLSVESLMAITSEVKPLSVSQSAVTPFSAAPPMKEPNAAALPVTFDRALTASSELPVMRTDMIALLAMIHLLHAFHFLHKQFDSRPPVELAGLLPPCPRAAAESGGQDQ